MTWFDAPSLIEGTELAVRILRSAGTPIDIRPTGVRVHAGTTVSQDLGLTPDDLGLQQLSVVFESPDPPAVRGFWQRVLDYTPTEDGLSDPLRRDPTIHIRPSTEPRPLRNRIHLDVVRPAAAVAQASPGEPSGPYGVCHTDPDGNEVDLVPAEPLAGAPDWHTAFSAMACYRTSSPAQQCALATAAAALATEAGFPLLIDLRPGLVILDSGKDMWEPHAHGLDLDFATLAAAISAAARGLGVAADPGMPRFTQLFLDAADVPAVRAFWLTTLNYAPDRRTGLTDIHDPRHLNPVLVFQPLDASDTPRRNQRNRIHLELTVPTTQAQSRVAKAIAANGHLLDQSESRWHLADPEGNELVITEHS
ncbi:VOC family protein [Paractinoplanes bogorensis]|nr:VOC family protein [Actinoplanes bogorensis]